MTMEELLAAISSGSHTGRNPRAGKFVPRKQQKLQSGRSWPPEVEKVCQLRQDTCRARMPTSANCSRGQALLVLRQEEQLLARVSR